VPALAARDRREELAERALAVAFRTARGVLGDREAAADVAQEVALQAVSARDTLRDPDAFGAWVLGFGVRAALREAGRARRRRSAEEARVALRAGAGEDDPLAGTLALLDGLPPRQRAALTLRYVHDLPDAEIAAAMRCRPGTVRSLLSRGRDAVRARLDEDAR
jgi:RNA polymerase sigma-70 factor (ECF subfamily)